METNTSMSDLKKNLITEQKKPQFLGEFQVNGSQRDEAFLKLPQQDEEYKVIEPIDKGKIKNLRELPSTLSIDDVLNNNKQDEIKPFSSRVKLVVEWDKDQNKYIMNEEDMEVLKEYIDIEEFFKTTKQIEEDINLRPFDRKTPFFNALGLRLLNWIFQLIILYIFFLILQFTLFNLIMLGIMCVYFKKAYNFFHAIQFKYDYNYRNRPFIKFIEIENNRFYRDKNIELIPGEGGKWLKLQLPDDIEEREKKEFIQSQLQSSPKSLKFPK